MKLQLAWLHGTVAAIHKAWLQWQPAIFKLRREYHIRPTAPFQTSSSEPKILGTSWVWGGAVSVSCLIEQGLSVRVPVPTRLARTIVCGQWPLVG